MSTAPGDVETLASRPAELLPDGDRWAEMVEEILRIMLRHGLENTLSAFEGLYGLLSSPRNDGKVPIVGGPGPVGAGDERVAAFGARPVGEVNGTSGGGDMLPP